MLRVDGFYLYSIGAAIKPLLSLEYNTKYSEAQFVLYGAQWRLEPLVMGTSVFHIQTSWVKGNELLTGIKSALAVIEAALGSSPQEDNELGWMHALTIKKAATAFETIFAAELQWSQLYLVQPKGGFDLNQLTDNGIVIFPKQLSEKVPEAIQDAREAARCIAFELPTAAAFHMHRLHELVLRRYYDEVTGGKPRPINRNIGAYIDGMKNHQFKDPKVFSALANLKDFHRNPVLHPDDRLEDVEEAIALLGSVNTVVTYMLKALKPAPLELTSPPSPETPALEDKTQE